MSFNPWHSVHFGEGATDVVKDIIEIPRNSRAKYELEGYRSIKIR